MIFQHGGPVLEGDNDSKEETTFYITLTIERDEDEDEASADEEDVEGCDEYDVNSGSASDHRHRVQRRPDASSTGTFEIAFMHICHDKDKDQVVICKKNLFPGMTSYSSHSFVSSAGDNDSTLSVNSSSTNSGTYCSSYSP